MLRNAARLIQVNLQSVNHTSLLTLTFQASLLPTDMFNKCMVVNRQRRPFSARTLPKSCRWAMRSRNRKRGGGVLHYDWSISLVSSHISMPMHLPYVIHNPDGFLSFQCPLTVWGRACVKCYSEQHILDNSGEISMRLRWSKNTVLAVYMYHRSAEGTSFSRAAGATAATQTCVSMYGVLKQADWLLILLRSRQYLWRIWKPEHLMSCHNSEDFFVDAQNNKCFISAADFKDCVCCLNPAGRS